MREFFELGEADIDEFVAIFEDEWYAILANITSDDKAAEVMERLLGTPDWTKRRVKSE
jgi:hypothetical protein